MSTAASVTDIAYRLAGYDLRPASAMRQDARRAQRWLETVSRGGTWEGLPPRPRPLARPVMMDSQGNRFVASLTRDGMISLRPYPQNARTAAGLSGGFVAVDDGAMESGGPAIKLPAGLAATLRNATQAEFAGIAQGDVAGAEAGGSSFWSLQGAGSQIAQGVAMQGFASVLQSGSGIGTFGGLSMSGFLGGLASIGSSTLIGMGLDQIAGLAMSAWAVDDESSTGEHLAHMATQKLMGELQGQAQSALMEAVLGPPGPPAPGSDASTLDQARDYLMGKPRGAGIAIAHNTSPTDHGGVLAATAAKTLAGGLTVGRLNDVQACPLFNGSTPHVGGPVNTANPTVIAEGLPVTGEDHTALCTGVGGQTLLKPTVQNVRIGPVGMPVAISSMGDVPEDAEQSPPPDKPDPSDSESNRSDADGDSSGSPEGKAEKTELEQKNDELLERRDELMDRMDNATSDEERDAMMKELETIEQERGELGRQRWEERRQEISERLRDPEVSDAERDALLRELRVNDEEFSIEDTPWPPEDETGPKGWTKRTEKDFGISQSGGFVQHQTVHEEKDGWFHTTTTNTTRVTIDPATGKKIVSGATESCHAFFFNSKDKLCYGFKGSVSGKGPSAGGGISIKGGDLGGGVYVVDLPKSRSPRDWFGGENSENGKRKIFIRIPWRKGKALEVSFSWKGKTAD